MIARRKALHKVWKANFVVYVASIFVKFPEIRGSGNDDLIVMQCENHVDLEDLVHYLLDLGLNMTRHGAFEDFAIVHGIHGIPMPCTWLDYRRETDGAKVSLTPERNFLEFDWSDAMSGYEGPGWIAPRGHGFVVTREKDYDVWVDFTTGGTVVNLHPLLPTAPEA